METEKTQLTGRTTTPSNTGEREPTSPTSPATSPTSPATSPTLPASSASPPAGAKAEPNHPELSRARPRARAGLRKPTIAIAGVAVLALGILLGIGATKYVAGIPFAAAATKTHKLLSSSAAAPAQASPSPTQWNPFQEIRDMQLQMDRMFDQMNSDFRLQPRLGTFVDSPGYSLSLRLRDMKDHYEVRAYLPNAKASDVKVSLLDKQTLKVEVSNSSQTANAKGASTNVSEWGQYAQLITLPSPVKSEQMTIDQPKHELLVTLPKA